MIQLHMPSKNPEVKARAHNIFNERHPDYQKQWHAENPSKRKVYQTKYEEANQEKIRAKGRAYYARNREKLRARQNAYRKAHPEKSYERSLKKKFGISLEQKAVQLAYQDDCCEICKRPIALLSSHVDHVHGSDPIIIRGLLCGSCNRAIGLFQDNPAILDRAADYLRTFEL